MAEARSKPQHDHARTNSTHRQEGASFMKFLPEMSLSTSQVLMLLAGASIGGMLLLLAGLSLIVSLVGLMIAVPLFILFSPVLVPAASVIGIAVTSIIAAGTCGLMGLVTFTWMVNYLRRVMVTPEQAKRRIAEMAGHVKQKTKEAGQDIETKAQDA
ncbi:oleosin 5 [Cajanus cajan]|uniref:Oleosin 5 n=1 Tax=Cajanus cajan TaxID=3821 RepID=A0A151SJ77_CAJCA|nr:oleosin 5 [Cajanus cajan]KYP54833.1 Oleosin 5 [Cajanus cajan]